MKSKIKKILLKKTTMKFDKKTMIINFGCVDLSDPELVEKFRNQKLQSDRVEELLKNHIWHDFKVPDELSDQIDLIDSKISDIDVYKIEDNYVSFDVTMEFKFKFLSKEAIKRVRDYQSKNDDLRANVSIFWKTLDSRKILFDRWWEEDIREEIEAEDWFK